MTKRLNCAKCALRFSCRWKATVPRLENQAKWRERVNGVHCQCRVGFGCIKLTSSFCVGNLFFSFMSLSVNTKWKYPWVGGRNNVSVNQFCIMIIHLRAIIHFLFGTIPLSHFLRQHLFVTPLRASLPPPIEQPFFSIPFHRPFCHSFHRPICHSLSHPILPLLPSPLCHSLSHPILPLPFTALFATTFHSPLCHSLSQPLFATTLSQPLFATPFHSPSLPLPFTALLCHSFPAHFATPFHSPLCHSLSQPLFATPFHSPSFATYETFHLHHTHIICTRVWLFHRNEGNLLTLLYLMATMNVNLLFTFMYCFSVYALLGVIFPARGIRRDLLRKA